MVNSFWGRTIFEFEAVEAVGRSGGLLTIWNPCVFDRQGVVKHHHFLVVTGQIRMSGELINFVNVHAQNDSGDRRLLWRELIQLKSSLPDEAELLEYQMGGRRFTYHSDSGKKLSKLDRFLVSREFMNKWPFASVVALSNTVSDHCPILLSTVQTDFGPIPCRLFNSWLDLPGAMEYVEELFPTFSFDGPSDLALATKLKWVKRRLKEWVNTYKFANGGLYVSKMERLDTLEVIAESRPLSNEELEERVECKSFIVEADRIKLMDLKQKSRVRWAKDGDENTSYFHGVVNANTSNNRINGLHIDGVWTTFPPAIKDYVFTFFEEKFKEPMAARPGLICPNLATLSDVDATNMVSPFSLAEIKVAVWECEGDRAPGPDGINFNFIKRWWEFLQHDFMNLFTHFHDNATLSLGCMSSFLALIPKKNDPVGLNDYRPISLVGCINKIISKVLINRLKPVIQSLVSEEQTAFLSGRSILDGALILNELIPWMKRFKRPGMIFKVDIEKAYDSLSWEFLESMLTQMNFHQKWRKWVMTIVKAARASVLVNGSPTQEFPCYRGLRQGDPLSPFLFVLAMETLTGVMKEACAIGLFKGMSISQHVPSLSHFLYADDVVFVGEWSLQNVLNLKRLLRCFYLASGLRVNLSKSNLFGVCVDEAHVQSMAEVLGCKKSSFPFKYLGLQVGANMNLIKNWDPVVNSFKKRLSVWKANTLSLGGRVTLVKSVLNALPTYYFSLFKAPLGVITQLKRLRRDFLWGASPENAKLKWVAWKNVITPKDYGGMGFGSLREANLAMMAKWWWRFKVDRSGLWRRVVWGIHRNSRTWSFVPIKLSISGPWKQLARVYLDLNEVGVDLVHMFRGKPGFDSQIYFWKESWLFDVPLYRRFPNLFELETNKNVLVGDRVKVVEGVNTIEFMWSRNPSSDAEEEELQVLLDAIGRFSFGAGLDKWNWTLENSGSFSVKSLRNKIQQASFSDLGIQFEWNSWSPIKINFLLWRLIQDRIPTAVALQRRNVDLPSVRCNLCNAFEESALHLFGACSVAIQVWDYIARWCRLKPIFILELKDLANIHNQNRGSKMWKKAVYLVVQTTIWCIWRSRNSTVFNRKRVSVTNIIEEIKLLGFLWMRSRIKGREITWESWVSFNLACLGV
ncbi:putative RNA-directed DNA polymerase [Helianthus annuus]|nr:putative RNA-directed DNA polymerase [Helianthus annuus]